MIEDQIEKGYLELPNFKFDKQELINLINNVDINEEWIVNPPGTYLAPNSKGPNGDYVIKEMPSSIAKNFKKNIYTWNGFVKLWPGALIEPHIDAMYGAGTGLESFSELQKQLENIGVKNWDTTARECGIFIPVYGDFNQSPTALFYKNPPENKLEKIVDLTFKHPTLVKTSGHIFHGVDNRNGIERATYQVSFNTPLTFEVVADLILKGELLHEAR
jgi:hypothetical protein